MATLPESSQPSPGWKIRRIFWIGVLSFVLFLYLIAHLTGITKLATPERIVRLAYFFLVSYALALVLVKIALWPWRRLPR